MKKLQITSNCQTTEKSTSLRDQTHILVNNVSEQWYLAIDNEDDENKNEKEVTGISIKLPNGKMWTGNIMDLSAIFSIAQNALKDIEDYASAGFTDSEDQVAVENTINELKTLLSHLK